MAVSAGETFVSEVVKKVGLKLGEMIFWSQSDQPEAYP